MNPRQQEPRYAEGRLPAMAPLANPYVPFQMEQPVRYEARKGLVRGTLYPGLDLPFMGMINRHNLPVSPMSELQASGFAVQELALYLDTTEMIWRLWSFTVNISKCMPNAGMNTSRTAVRSAICLPQTVRNTNGWMTPGPGNMPEIRRDNHVSV